MDGHVLAADAASSFDRDMLAPDGAPASAPSGQAIRDVLLHLDGGAQDEANVAHAEMVAMAFGAHVRGVFTHETPTDLLAAGPGGEGLAAEYWVIDGETAEAAEKAASSRLALIEPSTDLLRADGMPHELSNVVAALARSSRFTWAACAEVYQHAYDGTSGNEAPAR